MIEEIPEFKELGKGGIGISLALNFGLFYETPLTGMKTGITIQNYGPPIQYFEKRSPVPLPYLLRFGVSFSPTEFVYSLLSEKNQLENLWNINIIGDCIILRPDTSIQYEGGVEITVFKTLSYRVGYFEDKEGHRIGPTHGIGLILGPVRFDIAEDGEIYEFFTGPNWRVQTTLTSTNSSLKIPENNPAIALFCLYLCPVEVNFIIIKSGRVVLFLLPGFTWHTIIIISKSLGLR